MRMRIIGWFDDDCKKKRIVNDAKRAFLLDNTAITKSARQQKVLKLKQSMM